jgi:Zn-dependent M28 family amino/carboxypeptidase
VPMSRVPATDDGASVCTVLAAAAAAIHTSAVRPRRTLRFVLFTGEEQGEQASRAEYRYTIQP